MNVAMFTDAFSPRVNGVAVSVLSYAQELCRLGHRVVIVCPHYDKSRRCGLAQDSGGLAVLRVPSFKNPWSSEDRAMSVFCRRTLFGLLDAFCPDVVHVNSEFFAGLLGVRYAKKRGVPLVYTFHTLWEFYFENYAHVMPAAVCRAVGRGVVAFYIRRARQIVVPTERIGAAVLRYGIARVPCILPTGIPASLSHAESGQLDAFRERLFAEFPGLGGKKVLLFVGRVAVEKNIGFLFSVLEAVLPDVPDAALLVVGAGPDLDRLKAQAAKRPYADRIFFTGYRDRGQLCGFYRMARVFTFPSVTETQGLVTIEAMQNGLPVVAIGEMGTADVMQGDNGGFMVGNDRAEFAERTKQLLTDDALWQAKSAQARDWGAQWSLSALTPRLVAVYQQAVADVTPQH